MTASPRAAWIGVLTVLCTVVGAGSGSAQGGDGPPAASAAPASTAAAAPSTPSAPSAFDAAAAKADPDCKAADVACAWSHCNPLGRQWPSYHRCIADSCHVEQQSCFGDLIMDLNDPVRQKTGGRA